jgi:hypothetical protein
VDNDGTEWKGLGRGGSDWLNSFLTSRLRVGLLTGVGKLGQVLNAQVIYVQRLPGPPRTWGSAVSTASSVTFEAQV